MVIQGKVIYNLLMLNLEQPSSAETSLQDLLDVLLIGSLSRKPYKMCISEKFSGVLNFESEVILLFTII